jgi:MFS family permease
VRRDRTTGVVLVAMLALSKADGAIVGVLAPTLRDQFHLDDARLGLLASLASITGAVSALPAGGLVDRRHRPVLLAGALAIWSVALGVAGLATGFLLLALARLLSGCVATVARPAAVSLVGDVYAPSRRGRAMAALDAGQSAGTAVCFLLAALALRWFSWRMAFWWLGAAGLILAVAASRLTDPAPHGRTRFWGPRLEPPVFVDDGVVLEPIQATSPALVPGRVDGDALAITDPDVTAAGGGAASGRPPLPSPAPTTPPLWPVIVELCRNRTNRVVLIGEAVGNFFYAGVTSFAVLFAVERFGLATSDVDSAAPFVAVGIVTGLLLGGAVGDRMARSGGGSRRLVLACVLDLVAAALLVPAVAFHSLILSATLLTLAAAILSGGGPCLDAVRIDIVRPEIRGRAEAARGLLTLGASALAPVVFGLVAMSFGGQGSNGAGLGDAFLVMLLPLAASGVILLAGLRSYDSDVAAASASQPPHRLSFGTK